METQLEKTLQGNKDLSKRAQDAVGFHVFSQKKKKKSGPRKDEDSDKKNTGWAECWLATANRPQATSRQLNHSIFVCVCVCVRTY